jgi:hypothetical protein
VRGDSVCVDAEATEAARAAKRDKAAAKTKAGTQAPGGMDPHKASGGN